jgi:sec-independent protein translocase protein TatB
VLGMGVPEVALILVLALLLFGPEKLPELAKQAAGFVRTVRRMAEAVSDLNLRDLDPREIVRRNFLDDDAFSARDTTPSATKETRILRPGERPPFDPEAT